MSSSTIKDEIKFDILLKELGMTDNERNSVKQLHMQFLAFYEKVKEHPISSFIRTMEFSCRELSPILDNSFYVYYDEMRENKATSGAGLLTKSNSMIPLPINAGEDKRRNIIAHEMGHLYYAVRLLKAEMARDKINSNSIANANKWLIALSGYLTSNNYEKEADLIAFFILNERTKFYESRTTSFRKNLLQILKGLKESKEGK
jgi:Zn-dependent peptidase ImmA (M78 family)